MNLEERIREIVSPDYCDESFKRNNACTGDCTGCKSDAILAAVKEAGYVELAEKRAQRNCETCELHHKCYKVECNSHSAWQPKQPASIDYKKCDSCRFVTVCSRLTCSYEARTFTKQPAVLGETVMTDKQIAANLEIAGEDCTYKGDGFSVTTLDIHPVIKAQDAHTRREIAKYEREWLDVILAETCGCVDDKIRVHIAYLKTLEGTPKKK